MNKQNLIQLAQEKGFESEIFSPQMRDLVYYLWMCELQKWLEEKHSIHVYTQHWDCQWKFSHQHIKMCYNGITKEGFKTPQLALESGLYEALKLIEK